MGIGDLVVHIGASPNGYRVRLVVDFGTKYHSTSDERSMLRDIIFFVDGRYDWKDQWRKFSGWDNYENR